jgi:hypothetical protein
MKVLKEKISLIEAKSLQSFLDSHNIEVCLSNEYGIDSRLADVISVLVDEEDYNQCLRLLSSLSDPSYSADESSEPSEEEN